MRRWIDRKHNNHARTPLDGLFYFVTKYSAYESVTFQTFNFGLTEISRATEENMLSKPRL